MGGLFQGIAWWILPTRVVLTAAIVLALVIAISYGFELFSKITGFGRYDFMDAVASVIGGVLGMALVLIARLSILNL